MTRKNRLLTNRAISLLLCLLMLLLCIPYSAVAEGSLGRVEETTTADPEIPPFTTPEEDPPEEPLLPGLGTATPQPPIGDFRVPEKPSFIDETATRSVPLVTDLPDGNYHMRNLRTGLLLHAPVSTGSYARPVDMGFHTSNLGDEWIFEWQQGDTYIIRSRLYPDYALVDSGSVSLELIPEDGYWDMHHWYIYDYGGYYYIQSYLNQQYLCHDGENFFMSSTQPTSVNYSYLWDFVNVDDYTQLTGFTVNNDRWMSVGSADYVDITLTPSNASWSEYNEFADYDDFLWKTTDSSVAYVYGGRVFAGNAGYTIITAIHRATKQTYTFAITVGQIIPNGTYHIRNAKSNLFIGAQDTLTAEQKQFDISLLNLRWVLTYDSGYYSIKSWVTNNYLSAFYNSAQYNVFQTATLTDAGKWRILRSKDGQFVLQSKIFESPPIVLSAPIPYPNTYADGEVYTENDDYSDEWVILDVNATSVKNMLYSIYSYQHDHHSSLQGLQAALNQSYFLDVTMRAGSVPLSTCKNDLDTYNVFFSRSHGMKLLSYLDGQVLSIGLVLDDNETNVMFSHEFNGIEQRSGWGYLCDDYSNMNLAVFVGCQTGYGGVNGTNLAAKIVELGAEVAIGFNADIYCTYANTWTDMFYNRLLLGDSVNEAMAYMRLCEDTAISNITSVAVVCGNGDYRLIY